MSYYKDYVIKVRPLLLIWHNNAKRDLNCGHMVENIKKCKDFKYIIWIGNIKRKKGKKKKS